MFKIKRWRRLSIILLTVTAIIIALAVIAFDQAAALNAAFKIKTYKIIKDESSNVDANYFDLEYTEFGDEFSKRTTDVDALKAYMDATCEELEAEGLVLLKNDNDALPIEKTSKVSLFFQGSYNCNYSTSGSSATTSTTSYPTLTEALTALGVEVNPTLNEFNANAISSGNKRGFPNLVYKTREIGYDEYTVPTKASFDSYSDAAIFVISRNSGEGSDISTINSDGEDGTYLSLTKNEREVLEEITKLKNDNVFKKIVVLLNSAVPIQLDFIDNEKISIDAMMWIGNVGSTGIHAVAKALVGDVNPSGKLSDTFVKNSFSSPAMATWALNPKKSFSQKYTNFADHPEFNETQNCYGVYVEGIYVGYRYYETRYEDVMLGQGNTEGYNYYDDVAYPFGFGLSYTEFEYTDFMLDEEDDEFVITVTVTNVGDKAGKESVGAYIQKPYSDYDIENGIEKSAIELAGFTKTKLLSPGDDEEVTISIPKEMLKSYDAYGAKTYILDEGDYYFTVGRSAHDALNNIIVYKGYSADSDSDASLADYWTNYDIDTDTYSVSVETGNKITNQFDFTDLLLYENAGENTVTYVSRNDWEGTWPTENILITLTDEMAVDNTPNKPIIEDGSTMPKFEEDSGLSLIMLKGIEYDNELWDNLLNQMSYAEMSYLITNGQHNTVLIESVNKPATSDENGPNGVSGSLTGTAFPSEGIWASSFNPVLLKKAGEALGEDAVAAGITGLYAPGVNIHRTPFAGRAHEYFSEDPVLSGLACMYETRGMQEKGVWAYVKHYAVNNEETNRNGVAIFLNEQELREIMLVPFEYSFRPSMGNAHATMTSFNRIGVYWTSACSPLMETVLRDEWGFDGFAITDMAASNAKSFMTFVDGISNGSDCYDGSGSRTALDDYKTSPKFANKMREACHRILYVTVNNSAIMNGVSSTDKIVKQTSWWEGTIIALVTISSVLSLASIGLLTASYILKKK